MVLSNDDKGILSWVINVPNRPTLTGDMGFIVYINSDSNAATGDPQLLGSDYILQLIGPIDGPALAVLVPLEWNRLHAPRGSPRARSSSATQTA